jgi:FKBP-type peptidyl-prolyl cis-trans isomerase 2
MTNRSVSTGDTVAVHYTGRLDNGEVFDSSRGREPLSFTVGEGAIIPGFEAGVSGLQVGESRAVRVEPADGYGERRDDLVVQVDKARAPEGLSPNDRVRIGDQPAVVTEVTDDHVVVDANHPLAGQALNFEVEVVEIAS